MIARRPAPGGSRRRPLRLVAAGLACAALGTAGAVAQNVSNEAWLGQVGGLNVLDITQEGRGNSAGADNVWLLLAQDGVDNEMVIDQYGYENKLGTLFGDEDAYARGVWQRGDLNVIDISQRNTELGGTNVIGAIQQWSAYNLDPDSGAYNWLRVIQTSEDDATGIGAHYVGRIVQQNTGPASASPNVVFIVQRGGGAGDGNVMANLRQIGSGNSFGSRQEGTDNRIGELPPPGELPSGGIIQEGTANRAFLVQTGDANLVEYVQQYGYENASRVRLTGSRNVVSQILQNSESWSELALGNRIVVTISGDDNGGEGGWIGELIQFPALAVPGIAQATLNQLGDDNDISLVIVAGMENKYGATQVGDGNDIHVSISGASVGADAFRNETAVFQQGEVNYVSHTVTGNDNAGAVRMEGDRNRLLLTQRGDFSIARIGIAGDDNNTSTPLFGAALDLADAIGGVTLDPGTVLQEGTGLGEVAVNRIEFDVIGSMNAFAFYQNGNTNLLQGGMNGFANALAVVQMGIGNTSLLAQNGVSNTLAVHQF